MLGPPTGMTLRTRHDAVAATTSCHGNEGAVEICNPEPAICRHVGVGRPINAVLRRHDAVAVFGHRNVRATAISDTKPSAINGGADCPCQLCVGSERWKALRKKRRVERRRNEGTTSTLTPSGLVMTQSVPPLAATAT